MKKLILIMVLIFAFTGCSSTEPITHEALAEETGARVGETNVLYGWYLAGLQNVKGNTRQIKADYTGDIVNIDLDNIAVYDECGNKLKVQYFKVYDDNEIMILFNSKNTLEPKYLLVDYSGTDGILYKVNKLY